MSATDWIGRSETAHDHLSHNLLKRIAATFGEAVPEDGADIPSLWQWCFFQDPLPETALGTDGHPARGGFLPPADNRNRMWAGGRIEFLHALRAGEAATRVSTIVQVEEKTGRTGSLLFVTVRHDYSQDGRLAIREEQDIVYREPTPPKSGSGDALEQGGWSETVDPTPTLLFRYSAVTFNGHRILARSTGGLPIRTPRRDRRPSGTPVPRHRARRTRWHQRHGHHRRAGGSFGVAGAAFQHG
jgi:itaconyl-CoA hydratase/mesaconyl-C4 CoA hydratase